MSELTVDTTPSATVQLTVDSKLTVSANSPAFYFFQLLCSSVLEHKSYIIGIVFVISLAQ